MVQPRGGGGVVQRGGGGGVVQARGDGGTVQAGGDVGWSSLEVVVVRIQTQVTVNQSHPSLSLLLVRGLSLLPVIT